LAPIIGQSIIGAPVILIGVHQTENVPIHDAWS